MFPRVWLVALGSLALIALALVLRNLGGAGSASEAATRAPAQATAVEATSPTVLAATGSEQRGDVPVAAPSTASAASSATGPAPAIADPLADVWALIAQLEALANKPATYHEQALALIERLTELCESLESGPGSTPIAGGVATSSTTDQAARDTAGEAVDVLGVLLEQVVRSVERNELVRGAVALAIARRLPEADFWRLFDEWLALPREGSLELVRAAALAAALRGDEAPCHRELGLSRLNAMPGSEAERPGIYPVSLRRIASPAAGAALRRWLDLPDSRQVLFRGETPAIEDTKALASAIDYFVASEVLFCVWGHGAVVDSVVERELVRTALCEACESGPPDLLTLRAAHFVLRSLAECNAGLADGAHRASVSPIPIVAGLAKSMEALGGGGLSLKMMAEIERLRYSRSREEESDLLLLLVQANDALAVLGRSRTGGRENAIEYLLALAEDANVAEMGRGAAMTAVTDNSTWDELLGVVRRALASGVAGMQNYTAISALVDAAGNDSGRKQQALQLLEGLVSPSLDPEVLETINAALAELRS